MECLYGGYITVLFYIYIYEIAQIHVEIKRDTFLMNYALFI